jgi:YlmC/YmxH family sporulation protein
MRISELVGKEIVNVLDGSRLGVVGEPDLFIDIETGEINSIILPDRGNMITFWVDKQQVVIPWDAVKKIGSEVIIVELDATHINPNMYSY